MPGSPAADAGIEAGDAQLEIDGQPLRAGGDVIVAADDEPVESITDVITAVDAEQPGETIELTLLRGGDSRTVEVELGERPASTGE